MYAVNLADLLALPEIIRSSVKPQLSDRLVDLDRRYGDGQAVVLGCPDDQAAALVEVLQRGGRVRAFCQGPRGGWVPVAPQGRRPAPGRRPAAAARGALPSMPGVRP